MDPETYDESNASYFNYTDPYRITEAIANPENGEPGEEDFGYLNVQRDAMIFDIGTGPGVLGKLLTKKGFTNIEGAEPSTNFRNAASKSGCYRKTLDMFFG